MQTVNVDVSAPRSDTRERLIEAAIELFGNNGFGSTSLRDLASDVGLKAPAIYNHFKSKEELFAVAVTATLGHFCDMVVSVDDPALPPFERLEGLIGRHVTYQIENSRRAKANDRMIESHVIDRLLPSQRDAIRRLLRAYLDTMTAIVTGCLKELGRDTVDARLIALAIGSMCDNVLDWYRPNGRYDPQRVARHYARLAYGMITVSDPA
jgi:TetR/AcrR family transcriptional regulator, cholesterol catabolism regulator